VESCILAELDIQEAFITCARMLRVIHVQDLHDNPIDNLCLNISLGVEYHGISDFYIYK